MFSRLPPDPCMFSFCFPRCLVGLNPEKGNRVQKGYKAKPFTVNPKVLKLINDIAENDWIPHLD